MRGKSLTFFISITIIILAIIYIQQHRMTSFNKQPSNSGGQAVNEQQNCSIDIEKTALYSLMGKSVEDVKKRLGEPNRIDLSEYDYDWWIYNQSLDEYCQIGIDNGKVVTIFVMGDKVDIKPFQIGQSRAQLDEIIKPSENVDLEVQQNFYSFELAADELETTPLVQINKEIWAQVYFDKFNNQLSSIRFLDGQTLIKMRPYELVYRGELIEANEINLEKWKQIENGEAQQILDLTNIIRKRHGLEIVNWHDETSMVAYNHSKEMFEKDYFSHRSPTEGGLSDRLIKGGVQFKVAGENIAAHYVDAIAAVEGWQNSEGHRTTLLNNEFTHLGVGVFEKYYTQNFFQAW